MTKTWKSRLAVSTLVAASFLVLGCDRPNLKEDKGRYSYAIGYRLATNMKNQKVELDAASFSAAVKDVMAGKDARLSEEEMRTAIQKMTEARTAEMNEENKKLAEENIKKSSEFLAENKTKEGVKETDSGLQYKQIEAGSGKAPTADSVVEVHYRGRLIDGTEFDSSYKRNEPARFPVKAVIPGWTEALQMMKPGSKYELYIPPQLAYGEKGGPTIPPNSALIFEVELLKVVK